MTEKCERKINESRIRYTNNHNNPNIGTKDDFLNTGFSNHCICFPVQKLMYLVRLVKNATVEKRGYDNYYEILRRE
jgi:hypothetical protein